MHAMRIRSEDRIGSAEGADGEARMIQWSFQTKLTQEGESKLSGLRKRVVRCKRRGLERKIGFGLRKDEIE
jgi:hypothetical protein